MKKTLNNFYNKVFLKKTIKIYKPKLYSLLLFVCLFFYFKATVQATESTQLQVPLDFIKGISDQIKALQMKDEQKEKRLEKLEVELAVSKEEIKKMKTKYQRRMTR